MQQSLSWRKYFHIVKLYGMGLIDKILHRPKTDVQGKPYVTFTEYAPVFSSFSGQLHEQELTHAAIERFASACSKLEPEIRGNAKPRIARAVETSPNQFQSWPTFLKRLAAIYETDSTAFIIPEYAWDMKTITGIFPLKCSVAEIVDVSGEPWIKFTFPTGQNSAFPINDVCILSKFQYFSDFFGERNVLNNTMKLIQAQNEAQEAAIKNGANVRFIGALSGQVRDEEMEKKRKRFVESNLSSENNSGLMLYDTTFIDVKQVQQQNYTISDGEMERIENNVFNYFGINKRILQNEFDEDAWSAWYEGKIEPFAVALSEGLTRMLFTPREQINNRISFSANRLAYASNKSKQNMIRDMVDRGVMTINQALEILQLPSIGPDGDVRVIRGEYVNASSVTSAIKADGANLLEQPEPEPIEEEPEGDTPNK